MRISGSTTRIILDLMPLYKPEEEEERRLRKRTGRKMIERKERECGVKKTEQRERGKTGGGRKRW